MTITIKNLAGDVIFNVDAGSLSWANLSGADLSWADLSGADLRGASFSGANLRGANLSGANFSGANLRAANLLGANLSGANLSGANLSWASLSWADLSGADLSETTLRGTVGNMHELKSLHIDKYHVAWTSDRLQIGCKNYKIADWFAFDDDTIAAMDHGALEWWIKHKDFIRTAINLSPAKSTGICSGC